MNKSEQLFNQFQKEGVVENKSRPEHILQGKLDNWHQDNNFVVREIKLNDLEKMYREKLDKDYTPAELVKLGKNLFEELNNQYDINTPVHFFISNDENKNSILISRVDKITPSESPNETQKISELYQTISQYYLDKLRNETPFLVDISSREQYVYGEKYSMKTKEENIYLVDTDLYFDDKTTSLLTVVYWLARHSNIINNPKVIENIETFLDEYQGKFPKIELNVKDQQRLEQLNKFLAGQKFGPEILPAIPIFAENE